MGRCASTFDREEFTVSGRKYLIRVENLSPVLPEDEKAEQKRKIGGNLLEIFNRALRGGEIT